MKVNTNIIILFSILCSTCSINSNDVIEKSNPKELDVKIDKDGIHSTTRNERLIKDTFNLIAQDSIKWDPRV